MQENINQENLELLKEYYKLFTEKMPPDCKYKIMQYANGFENVCYIEDPKKVTLPQY